MSGRCALFQRASPAWSSSIAGLVLIAALACLGLRGIAALPAQWTIQPAFALCLAGTAAMFATGPRRRGRALLPVGAAVALCCAAAILWQLLAPVAASVSSIARALPLPLAFILLAQATAGMLLCGSRMNSLRRLCVRACAGTSFLIAVEVLLEHVVPDAHPNTCFAGVTPLPLMLVAALACAAWLSVPAAPGTEHTEQADRLLAWCPALLAGLLVIAWGHLQEREWHEQRRDAATARDTMAGDIAGRLRARADALQRLTDRWESHPEPARQRWEREARDYLRDFPSLYALIFANPDLTVRWRVARADSARLVGHSLWADDERLSALREARATGLVRLTPVIELRSGGPGLALVSPVQSDGKLQGYMTASMRVTDLLDGARAPALRNFGVRLRDANGVIAAQNEDTPAVAQALVQRGAFDAVGQRWSLEVWPRAEHLARARSRQPETVFFLGALAVALLTAALVQFRRSLLSSAKAQNSAARLTATLECITDAFITLDADWRFTYVNAEAERLLERQRETLLGRVIWNEFPQAAGSNFQRQYEAALALRATVTFDEYYAPLRRWFCVRAYPSSSGLAVYFQDVTQFVRNRDALRESERELRALAESMPQNVWTARPDGAVTYFNQRWMDYSGLNQQDSLGEGWQRCVHPADLDALRSAWRRSRGEGSALNSECRMRRADGQYRWMLVRAVPFKGPDGQTLKWMGTCTDIDEIRRSEEAVRISEERFRLLSLASKDAILDCELATRALWCSDSFASLFGQDAGTSPTLDDWTARIHPDDRASVLAILGRALAEGPDVWSAAYRFRRSDGSWAHVRDRGRVLRDASGQAARMLCSMTDATEQVRLEDRLRQSQRLEALGQLTGGVAHDFNNLLTVIIGNAELLGDVLREDEELGAVAQMVLDAAERGAGLTQRLLAFGRKQSLRPVAVDLRRQLGQLEPLLRRTLGEHVRVELALPDGLWPAMVDPAQFDSAILNLCLNARDAMPAGGVIRIQGANRVLAHDLARQCPELRAGDYVEVIVSDSGAGIAAQHLERVFEPFFTTKETGKGSGLGLAMVYGFVKQSGGQIDLESQVGRGTTVRICLPRATDEAVPPPPASPGAMPEGHARILVVEDDPLVRINAGRQLRSLGYEVVEAEGPEQALAVLQGDEPLDLLFTDIVMPGINGPRLAQAAVDRRPGLRVLYTSGYGHDVIDPEQRRLPGGFELLQKPYSREDLATRVSAVLAPSIGGG